MSATVPHTARTRDRSRRPSGLAHGRFIVFEGGDGTGKSTQASLLAPSIGAVLTREPGGTAIGEAMRNLWLDPASSTMGDRTEAMLLAAARAQHVDELIAPTLASGHHVVCDRFVYSSIAYQGHGRGLPIDRLGAVNEWAVDGHWPDLVVLIEVSDVIAVARLGGSVDRVEAMGDSFHHRVRAAFSAMAADDPDRWVVVDGAASIESVATRVRAAVTERLGL
jgi:dTMP kinase